MPIRHRASSAEFFVTWVPKVRSFRQLPEAVKAHPPPLTTDLLFANSEKELADPYGLMQDWFGSDSIPEVSDRVWTPNFGEIGIQLIAGSVLCVLVKPGPVLRM